MKNKIYRPFAVTIALGGLISMAGCVPVGNAGGFVAVRGENPPGYDQPAYNHSRDYRPEDHRRVDADFGDRQRQIIQHYYVKRAHERERERYARERRHEERHGDRYVHERHHGHDHGRGNGYDRHHEREHGYGQDHGRRGLPPGLARRQQLPPGLQRQIRRHGTLPPGLRTRPLPRTLEARLPPPPPHCVRVLVGTDIVLLNKRTRAVLDVIRDVAQLSQ